MDARANLEARIQEANALNLANMLQVLGADGKNIGKTAFLASFNEANENYHTEKENVKGDNNWIILPENNHFAILFSEVRPQAREAVNALIKTLRGTPEWLAKEYRVELVKDSPHYRNADNATRTKTFPEEYNPFDIGLTASVSVIETIPGNISGNHLNDQARIEFARDITRQTIEMLNDLNKAKCVWTDMKPGNILLREKDADGKNKIAVADLKGLYPVNHALVRKTLAFDKQVAKNAEDFTDMLKNQKQDECLFMRTEKGALEFNVKTANGNVKGEISEAELKDKLGKDFSKFNANLGAATPKLLESHAEKLFEMIGEKHKIRTVAYQARSLNESPGYTSAEYENASNKKYDSVKQARDSVLETWNKEYSYQLALVTYHAMTGETKLRKENFDFNRPIFQSPEGEKMKDMIIKLSANDLDQRMTLKQADKLVSGKPSVEEKRGRFIKSSSKLFSKAHIDTPLKEKEMPQKEIAKEKSVSFAPEQQEKERRGHEQQMMSKYDKSRPQMERKSSQIFRDKDKVEDTNTNKPRMK